MVTEMKAVVVIESFVVGTAISFILSRAPRSASFTFMLERPSCAPLLYSEEGVK